MIIYFEDGKLSNNPPAYSMSKCYIIDAAYGYSKNSQDLEVLFGEEEFSDNRIIIYTNSLIALSNKYCWNDKLKVPELYLRKDSNSDFIRVDNLTDKEIHKAHNLMQMYINGAFK